MLQVYYQNISFIRTLVLGRLVLDVLAYRQRILFVEDAAEDASGKRQATYITVEEEILLVKDQQKMMLCHALPRSFNLNISVVGGHIPGIRLPQLLIRGPQRSLISDGVAPTTHQENSQAKMSSSW